MSSKRGKGGNADYDIGYCKPPHWSRFKEKQSGNLGGRPRKYKKSDIADEDMDQSNFDDRLRAEFARVLTINEGAKSRKATVRELVPRAQVNAALKGSPHAQRDVMKLIRELEFRDAQREEAQRQRQITERQDAIRTYNYVVSWKKQRAEEWDQAQARVQLPTKLWPHPDDILLYPETMRWDVRGPFNETEVALFEYYRAERDYMFACACLNKRLRKRRSEEWQTIDMLLWTAWDVRLPLRWQISHDCINALWLFRVIPLRKLRSYTKMAGERCEIKKVIAGVDSPDKEVYRKTNAMMKPLLKRYGYRSLAEFEHALEIHGDNMPLVKTSLVKRVV